MQQQADCEEPVEVERSSEATDRPSRSSWFCWKFLWIAALVLLASSAATLAYYASSYGRIVEQELLRGTFQDTASIFVNPTTLAIGAAASAEATVVDQYQLAPQLITNVSLRSRERRRLLRFGEIPQSLINAVVSVEDKRFFQHQGFDVRRIVKAAYVNIKSGRAAEGASTITMQLVRSLLLKRDKTFKRKGVQLFMALRLEQKLSKSQIFEYYANEVYLGHRGTYDIHGFGEAARVYFNKSIGALTLVEAATLAGVIQRPSYYNPFQFPERVRERRDQVLVLMRRNSYLTDRELVLAAAEALTLSPTAGESVEAPYYVDLVKAEIRRQVADVHPGREGYQVYSTLDLRLQRAAEEAVRIGMLSVDKQLHHPDTSPQVALIALDPRTGAIKALIGGRDYNASQLNHTLASRQPGSVFKPFVYAAALRAAEQKGAGTFTPATLLEDMPTTFWFDQQPYEPSNFKQQFGGEVTLRQALSQSMNVATIKLAERVGYGSVVGMARSAGFGKEIQPTPSVALGAYESTPLEIAAAYTVFANQGMYVQPHMVSYVLGDDGARIYSHRPVTHRALTPQVAYIMVNLLEEVLRSGTGASVRTRGFAAPAAGKTGTSRDGWFAGFTSDLLCVVWVGFDDHRDLKLEGANSALPIWTEFMKRAVTVMGPPKSFQRPSGIVTVEIDPASGQLATPQCPDVRTEVFLAGTKPVKFCDRHDSSSADTGTAAASVGAAK